MYLSLFVAVQSVSSHLSTAAELQGLERESQTMYSEYASYVIWQNSTINPNTWYLIYKQIYTTESDKMYDIEEGSIRVFK